MNTFLPYDDFAKSAECLDYRRLGKQRVETWQIYQCLIGQGSLRWKNHPCVKMWKGYEQLLCYYGIYMCNEWIHRGYKDTLRDRFLNEMINLHKIEGIKTELPVWLDDEKFHTAYRSNLLRKDPIFYGKYGWKESGDLPYTWGRI